MSEAPPFLSDEQAASLDVSVPGDTSTNSPQRLLSVSVTTGAITYYFRTDSAGFRSWALCTVNDDTGELLITSDWGEWAHRWNVRHLGVPSLTAFIGEGDIDYLARKMQPGRQGQRFSAEKTVDALRQALCDRRRADGREQLENKLDPEDFDYGRLPKHCATRYTEEGLPLFSGREVHAPTWKDADRREHLRYLTAEEACRIWCEIGELASRCSADLLYERLQSIDGFADYVTEEPWEYHTTEQTPEDQALRSLILPALIEACRKQAAALGGASMRTGAQTDENLEVPAGAVTPSGAPQMPDDACPSTDAVNKNRTRYKSLNRLARDPRIVAIWDEGEDGIWAQLAPGYNFDGSSCLHEWTVRDLLHAWHARISVGSSS